MVGQHQCSVSVWDISHKYCIKSTIASVWAWLGWAGLGLPVAAAAVFIQLLQSRRPRWLADTGTL